MDQTFRPGKAVRSRRSASDALFGSLGIWGCLRIFCAKKRLVLRWVFLLPVLIKLPVIHLFFLKSRKYPIACVIAGLCQQYQLNRKTSPALAGNRYLAARSAAWRRTNPCPSACASVTAVLRSTKAGVQTPATPSSCASIAAAPIRSTKAGVQTPATLEHSCLLVASVQFRSTKAGVQTPATPHGTGLSLSIGISALNEGRSANSGDTFC